MKKIFILLLTMFLSINSFSDKIGLINNPIPNCLFLVESPLKMELKNFKRSAINRTKLFDEGYLKNCSTLETGEAGNEERYSAFVSEAIKAKEIIWSNCIIDGTFDGTRNQESVNNRKKCEKCLLAYDPIEEAIYVLFSLWDDTAGSMRLPDKYRNLHKLTELKDEYIKIVNDSYKDIVDEETRIYKGYLINNSTPLKKQKEILEESNMSERLHELLEVYKEYDNYEIKVEGYKYVKKFIVVCHSIDEIYFEKRKKERQ